MRSFLEVIQSVVKGYDKHYFAIKCANMKGKIDEGSMNRKESISEITPLPENTKKVAVK